MENLQATKYLLEYIYTNDIIFSYNDDIQDLEMQLGLVKFAMRYELDDLLTFVLRNILVRLVNF